MRKLKTLDLFSGIGGFALALKPFSKIVGYCEIDDYCRKVLSARMVTGDIDTAPIFSDVTTLDMQVISKLRPVMLTAGFPCQDITSVNRFAKGLDGERSKLVYEIFKIIDSSPSLQYVLLENSPSIIGKGLDAILSCFANRRWTFRWSVFSALEVGGYHVRRRWVCLANAPNARHLELARMHVDISTINHQPPRLIQSSPFNTLRNMCLGNAVVPAMIYHACEVLSSFDESTASVSTGANIVVGTRKFFRHVEHKRNDLNLVYNINGQLIIKRYWSTPTRRKPYNCDINMSNLRHLSCQVILEQGSKGKGVLNAKFTEWLMGFPPDWTFTS